MAGEWREYTFADLIKSSALEIGDGYRAKNSELGGDGPIFLRAGHVRDTHIDLDGVDRFRRELAGAVASKMSRPGDVLVTTKGNSTGRTSYVGDNLPPVVYSPHLSYWRSLDDQVIDAGFLRYWSRSQHFQDQLDGLAASTDMAPYLSLADQKRLRITLPPPGEQRAIGRILGSLDDKIDLNRRTNETLEAIARALFKSWFVDFDPVRAKAEGRDSGLPGDLADLFSDSFEDSELGEIPRGWKVAPLGDIADVIDCSHAKKPERREHGWPLLHLSNIRVDGLLDMTDTYFIDGSDYRAWTARIEASPGDCVITNVGRVGAVAQIPGGLTAALGRNMTGVRCKPFFACPTFLLEALLSEVFRNEVALNTDTGTILDALNVRSIPTLRLVLPDGDLAMRFEEIGRPIRAKMEANVEERRTLVDLRDAVLPKLMSGELRLGSVA